MTRDEGLAHRLRERLEDDSAATGENEAGREEAGAKKEAQKR